MDRPEKSAQLAAILAWLHRGEDVLLSILLLLTLGLALGQILLRNFTGTGLVWADATVRVLVLWLGMLGAMIATREKRHISIDLISRYLSASRQIAVESVVLFFSTSVCAIAAYFSLLFVISELDAGEIVFAWLPAWICEAILPAAFSIITIRFAVQSIQCLFRLRSRGAS